MINKNLCKILAIILCICTLPLSFANTSIKSYAAEPVGTACITGYPRANDELADYSGTWGRNALNFMNGWACTENVYINLYSMNTHESNICYCIELGTDIRNGYSYTQKDESYWDSYPAKYNKTLTPDEIKLMIGRILYFGYAGKVSADWVSQNAEDRKLLARAFATQILIWETIVGERDINFVHVDPSPNSKIINMVKQKNPIKADIAEEYKAIVAGVKAQLKIASFTTKEKSGAKTYTLKWDGSKYTKTITDTKGLLLDYSFSCSDSSVKFNISGDNLTISSAKAFDEELIIKAVKKAYRKTVLTWTDNKFSPGVGQQDSVTYGSNIADNQISYFKISTPKGNLQIIKSSEDGKISNVSFKIKGQGIEKSIKTDSKGKALLQDLPLGKYTVSETVDDIYISQQSKTVTVTNGATVSVPFDNKLKRGNIKVIKSSEDDFIEGIRFHLYGKSQSGENVDIYAITDKDGVAVFNDLLIGTSYILEEIETHERYLLPETQNVKVLWDKTQTYRFENKLKKGSLCIYKRDAENNQLLTGAEFTVIRDINENKVYDEEIDIILGQMTQTDDGVFEYADLTYGSYLVYESAVPSGYESEDKYYPFAICEDGEKIALEILNSKIPEATTEAETEAESETTTEPTTEPETTMPETTTTVETTTEIVSETETTTAPPQDYSPNPKTGDNGFILMFCLISLSVISVCTLLIIRRKEGGHLE